MQLRSLLKHTKNRNFEQRNRRCKEEPNGKIRIEKYNNLNKNTQWMGPRAEQMR